MNRDRVYSLHILEALERISSYTTEGRQKFFSSLLIQDAVIRNFEIIGEASKRLSDEIKTQRPEIPWRQVAGLRDILIHEYEGVDHIEVWNIIEKDLPKLRDTINSILER